MPIYVYRCPKCGEENDVRLPMEHDRPIHCSEYMQRVFTPAAIHMKMSTKEKVTEGLGVADGLSPAYKKMAMSGFEKEKSFY